MVATAFALSALLAGAPDSLATDPVADFPTTVVHGMRKPSSMEDALENEPSLALVRRGPWAAEPLRRGAGIGRFLTTLDGARIQGACTDHMDPASSYVEPQALDPLRVASGPESGSGGGGVAGTLDLPLRRPPAQASPWRARADAEAATNRREAAASASFSGATASFGQNLTATWRAAGDLRGPDDVAVPLSGGRVLQAGSRSEWRGGNGRILSLRLLFDESRDVGYPGLPMDAGLARALQAGLGLEGPLAGGGAEALVYANHVRHEMDDTRRDSVAMHMDMPGEANTAGAWARWEGGSGSWGFRGRLEAWRTFQRAEMTMYPTGAAEMFLLTWPDATTRGARAEAEADWRADDRIRLRAGGSMEGRYLGLESELGLREVRIVDPDAGPGRGFALPGVSLGARWEPFEAIRLDAGLARDTRAPDAAELWGFYLYRARDGRDQIGHAGLRPETWNKLEASMDWSGSNAGVRAVVWGALVQDAIETAPDTVPTMTPGARGTVRWGNRGTWLRRGLELRTRFRRGALAAKADFSWMAVDGPEGREGAQVPAPGGRLRAGWNAVPARLEIALLAEWAVPQRHVDAAEGETASEGYFVPDLELTGQFPSRRIRAGWRLLLENPLDLSWRSHLDWGVAPRPGRGLRAHLWTEI